MSAWGDVSRAKGDMIELDGYRFHIAIDGHQVQHGYPTLELAEEAAKQESAGRGR